MDPNYAVAPGDYLQEWLEETGTTQQQAADQLGYSRKHVNEIVNGRTVINGEAATRLQRVTGIPADSWLAFEAAYQADRARLRDEQDLASHVDNIPAQVATYLRKHGHTTATRRDPGRLVADFLAFHRCGTFDAYTALCESRTQGEYALAALKESKKEPHPAAISTWLRAAELTDAYQEARSLTYDEEALRALLPALRDRCARPDESMLADAATLLKTTGVALLFVEAPEGFPLHGVTRWIDQRIPLIQQTGRRSKDGFLVWTLFHEIGHILNDPRGELHVEYTTERKRNTAAEKGANSFAMDTLFGADGLAAFQGANYDHDILARSQTIGVSPGLAVFMLHRKRLLDYSFGNRLLTELQPPFSV